jgi:hypothetical protein
MDRNQIQEVLKAAQDRFLADDIYLLTANANERSLTHKFAEHLQGLLGHEWSVDCEYNRYGVEAKKIIDEVRRIVGPYVPTDETKARTVYPDIIIHKRGATGPNLLVIEAKKDASGPEREGDWWKLARIKEQYSYSFAAFVNFVTAEGTIELEVRE